jgi:hypothetical protein
MSAINIHKLVEDFENAAQERRAEWERVCAALKQMELDDPTLIGSEFYDVGDEDVLVSAKVHKAYKGLLKRRDVLADKIETSLINGITVFAKAIEAQTKLGARIEIHDVLQVALQISTKAMRLIPRDRHPQFMMQFQEVKVNLEQKYRQLDLSPVIDAMNKPAPLPES